MTGGSGAGVSASERRTHWRIGRAPLGLSTAFAVGLVALLAGGAVAAPAASHPSLVSYGPPYTGTTSAVLFGVVSGCGASGGYPVFPGFNLTTGNATSTQKAASKSCGGASTSSSFAAIISFETLAFTTTAGLHHIKAVWTLRYTVSLAATPGPTGQSASASYSVQLSLYLYDRTNGTTFFQNHTVIVSSAITTGAYTHVFAGLKKTVYLNATLVAGHSYQIQAEISASAATSVSALGSTSSAMLNMGSAGKAGTMTSLTRT